jgi:hypothetical protein
MMDFKQAEKRFKQLKAKFEEGTLTENAFKAKLEELMIQDERGEWWMLGFETELWYRNDGTDWVQADPTTSHSRELTRIPEWLAIFLTTLGWAIGGAIGGAIYWGMDEYVGSAIGGVSAWGIGGLVTVLILHRGHILSSWKSIVWVTLAWAISGAIGWTLGEVITEVIGAAIGAGVGGAIGRAITLRNEQVHIDEKNMLWTTLAWAISMAIGWTIARIIQIDNDGAIGWPIGMAISGAIGGFVMTWQMRNENKS